LFSVLALLAAPPARANDVSWVGVTTGVAAWNSAGNWSGNAVPGPGDNVSISSPASFNISITSGTWAVGSLRVSGQLFTSPATEADYTLDVLGDFVRSGSVALAFRVGTVPRLHLHVGGSVVIEADNAAATQFGVGNSTVYGPLASMVVDGLFDIRQTNAALGYSVNFYVTDGHLDGGLAFAPGAAAVVNLFNATGGTGGLSTAFLESSGAAGYIQGSGVAANTVRAVLTLDGMTGTHTFMSTLRNSNVATSTLSLNKTGANTQILAGVTSYTGSTAISGGVLRFDGNASAAAGAVDVFSGGALGGTGTLGSSAAPGGAVTVRDGGTLLGAAGSVFVLNKSLVLGAGANLDIALGASGGAALFRVNGDITLDGVINITDAGGFGAGVYRIFDYSNGTLTDNGIGFGAAPGDGAALSLSLDTSVAGRVDLVNAGGGELLFWNNGAGAWASGGAGWLDTGGDAQTWDAGGAFAVFRDTGGDVSVDGSVALKGMQFASGGYSLTGGGTLAVGDARTMIRVGDGTREGGAGMGATIATVIGGTGGIVKADFGTLILTGGNTYAGVTRVSAGTLLVNGDQSAATGDVVVDGLAVLGGDGILGGHVTAGPEAVLLGIAGRTLTMPGLTMNGARMDITLGNEPQSAPLFQVNGDAVLDGFLDLDVLDPASFASGTYRLLDYTGDLGGMNLRLGAVPPVLADSLKLKFDTSVANSVNLDIRLMLPYWTGTGGAGGGGVWSADAASASWMSDATGMSGGWEEGRAVFRGLPGVVTVSDTAGPVSFAGMRFETSGYELRGDGLWLGGEPASPVTIQVGDDNSQRTFTAALGSALAGDAALEKTGGGALILTGSNRYTGGTIVRGGVLDVSADHNLGDAAGGVLIDGGVLRFSGALASARELTVGDAGATLDTGLLPVTVEWRGPLSGGGALTKTGGIGKVVLSGPNTFSGELRVNTGEIRLEHANLAKVIIDNYGALSGSGTINGNIDNSGLLAPEGMAVTGNLTLFNTAGQIIEIVLDSPAAPAPLRVNGNVASAARMAFKIHVAPGGGIEPGTSYTLIEAGTISADLAVKTVDTSDFPVMFDPNLEVDATTVRLHLAQKPYSLLPATGNQAGVARVLDDMIAENGGGDLVRSLNQLRTSRDVRAALNELSPLRYGRWFNEALYVANATVRAIENRLAPDAAPGAPRTGLWTEYTRRKLKFDDSPNIAAGQSVANAAILGADFHAGAALRLGAAVVFGREDMELDGNGSGTTLDRCAAFIYGQYDLKGMVFELTAGAGHAAMDNHRVVAIPGIAGVAESSADSRDYLAGLRMGKWLDVRGGLKIMPYAGAQWFGWKADGFDETGAGVATLRVRAMSGHSFASRLGIALAWPRVVRNAVFTPRLDIAWRHEFNTHARQVTAELAGRAFTVDDAPDNRFAQGGSPYMDGENGLSASAGFDLALGGRAALWFRLDGDWSMPANNILEWTAGVSVRF
jgi:autotransporter-associated beta strand protein